LSGERSTLVRLPDRARAASKTSGADPFVRDQNAAGPADPRWL
jgi:hypothetical protein